VSGLGETKLHRGVAISVPGWSDSVGARRLLPKWLGHAWPMAEPAVRLDCAQMARYFEEA